MRTILIALMAAGLCALAPQARAHDGDATVRAALAERLIAAMVRDAIDKVVEGIVEQMLAESTNTTDEQATWTRANVPEIMRRHLEVMIDESEALYAERFTEQELRALVEFYETPMGRTIALKQNEVGAQQGQGMATFIQAFAADYQAKYCAAFTCPGGSPDAAGVAKN